MFLFIHLQTDEIKRKNMFQQMINNNWWRSQLLQVVSQVVVS